MALLRLEAFLCQQSGRISQSYVVTRQEVIVQQEKM
jgi:hypothetical protein